jgi:hypothetical protein
MDYGLLNALGITIMAVFGLWAFCAAAKRTRKKNGSADGKSDA